MAGYILILAIIILGGAIATVGDRIGSRVGKARLSLFKLRPRTTAVLVTILTGSIISGSTLGILFATNKQLRDAVFRIESIQRQRQQAEVDLADALKQKEEIQKALGSAKTELSDARTNLKQVNQSLAKSIARQRQTQAQLSQLQARFLKAQTELRQFSEQGRVLRREILRLAAEQQQLQAERQRLIVQRDQVQGRLKQAEGQKEQLEDSVRQAQTRLQQVENQKQTLEAEIVQSQTRLQQAEADQTRLQTAVAQVKAQFEQANDQRSQLLAQQDQLQKEVTTLETNRKRLEENVRVLLLGIRRGNITIRTGQVLAVGSIQKLNEETAVKAVEEILREARRNAIALTKPQQVAPSQRVVQITNDDVEQLIKQISDGKPYVIRILSAANYLEGESSVLVVPQVARNQVIFKRGQTVASVVLNPTAMKNEDILNRLDSLFKEANQQAIQAGLLTDPVTGAVGTFQRIDLIKFVLDLKAYQGEITVDAVVPEAVYTSGPLSIELEAIRDRRVILRSNES
ncbi:MAG: DUF3084 domain-containing protein [Aphanocapsa sp. GSE-SYN-MK-11-07L]|jgi:uncharacterized protein (DUF3084 family)|nr:DUF3084 domain-containing protein [Aphanocapsa sp. GSE-SYN-MK-11-07L]